MQQSRLFAHVLLSIAYLAGCAGGNGADEDAPASPFAESEQLTPGGMAEGAPSSDAPSSGSDGEAAPGEAMDPGLDLAPAEPSDTPPGSEDAPMLIGNGRIVDSVCRPVCASDATDPDPMTGATDGWGFENGLSCLTPMSELALASAPCDLPELMPLPELPPELPEGSVPRPAGNLSSGFFVAEGRLFDRLGNDFVMRGINHPVVWFQAQALNWLEEIASTGANSVRLVWQTDIGSPAILRAVIQRSVELQMVPMVELHDVTGGTDVNQPAQMARYYVDVLRDVLLEFEPYLLVNIANEWGDFQTSDDDWAQAYRQAISVLRDGGVNHTLVIDSSQFGQRVSTVLAEGPSLLESDPQHNLLFSIHVYEAYANPQSILDALRGAVNASLPLIVGEFGFQHGQGPVAVPYDVLVAEAERLGIGYLAWSWTGNSGGVEYLDLSIDGTADSLTEWGEDIINGVNGIRSSSVPARMFLTD